MAEPLAPRGEAHAAHTEDREHPEVDWEAIERSPEFQELVRRRRGFVLPATAFFLTYFMAFIVVCAYAPDFMGERVYQGLTVGYTFALSQILMVFVLGLWYLRKAGSEFDPLSERAVAGYSQTGSERPRHADGAATNGRFERDAGAVSATEQETVR